jgi:peptidoglycan/xylan/chitin deacetylase (PgdA/CDA1 family)
MPALMYHDVVPAGADDSSGFPGRDAAIYKITPERFESHLQELVRLKADTTYERSRGTYQRSRSVRLKPDATHDPPDATSDQPDLTLDDGGVSAMRAADLLEQYGMRGHFFITSNYVSAPGFLTPAHIRDLQRRGHTIGSHSCSHPLRMGHCPWTRLVDEWTASRDLISAIVGEPTTTASIPGGDYAPAVAEAAALAGYTTLFTSEPTARTRRVSGLALRGRFTIQRSTDRRTVAGLASGAWLPCTLQAVGWNAKKLGKQLAGERYLWLRQLLLRPGTRVHWGDQRTSRHERPDVI